MAERVEKDGSETLERDTPLDRGAGGEAAFVREALLAFNQRPGRAEPLYDLARHHRDRSLHAPAALFAEAGLVRLRPPPGDRPSVEPFDYEIGLLEELSIAANYADDPMQRSRGFDACDWLALSSSAPPQSRDLARHNLRYYVEPAQRTFPSFQTTATAAQRPGDQVHERDAPTSGGALHGLAQWAVDSLTPESQAVPFDGGRLVLAREAWSGAAQDSPTLWHRFVRLGADGAVTAVGRPFYFQTLGDERATGLELEPGGGALIVTYSSVDGRPATASVAVSEVRLSLLDLSQYASRARGASAVSAPERKPRIWLFIPYFGALPNYFQLYLDSLSNNDDCLSVLFLTDIDLSKYRVPKNLVVVPMTLDALRARTASFMRTEFAVDVDESSVLKQPYKICDFRILFPEMLSDLAEQHGASESDFVGWGDCDLIYGRFSDFIETRDDFQIVGGYHGHLTAVRNVDSFKKLFRNVPDLIPLLLDERACVVDEDAFREPLLDLLRSSGFGMFYMNRYFCDVVPDCFVSRWRSDDQLRDNNFFDLYHPDQEIDYIEYGRDGRLVVYYDDGTSRPAIYCHLQKRQMELDSDEYPDGYRIHEASFVRLS